jgi:NhaA family Na+:H+ antiporter
MATDIAFAVGVLALVAPRVPDSVRVFLLALAIVDDIGAIVVIAIFYSGSIDFLWFGVAVGGVACAYVVRRHGRVMAPGLVVLGLGVWLALHAAGVHPTIAGVVFGLLVPASSLRRGTSPLEWLEQRIHPWSTWLIMPMFALANAGVTLPTDSIRDAAGSPVTIGVLLGLVAGKIIGIVAAARVACRLGWADLPTDATWRHVGGVAALGGIGFTVSLFVTRLAFDDDTLVANATIGIYVAAAAASLVALIIFWRTRTPTARSGPGRAWRRRGARTRPRQTATPHQAR